VTDGESDEKVEDEVGKKTDLYKTDPQNTFVHLSAMPKLSAQNCNIFSVKRTTRRQTFITAG